MINHTVMLPTSALAETPISAEEAGKLPGSGTAGCRRVRNGPAYAGLTGAVDEIEIPYLCSKAWRMERFFEQY